MVIDEYIGFQAFEEKFIYEKIQMNKHQSIPLNSYIKESKIYRASKKIHDVIIVSNQGTFFGTLCTEYEYVLIFQWILLLYNLCADVLFNCHPLVVYKSSSMDHGSILVHPNNERNLCKEISLSSQHNIMSDKSGMLKIIIVRSLNIFYCICSSI